MKEALFRFCVSRHGLYVAKKTTTRGQQRSNPAMTQHAAVRATWASRSHLRVLLILRGRHAYLVAPSHQYRVLVKSHRCGAWIAPTCSLDQQRPVWVSSTSPNISSRRSCVPLPIPQRCVTFGTHRSSVRGERKGEDCSRGVSVCLCLWPSSSVSMQLFIHFAGQAGRMPEPRLRSTRQKVSHTTLLRGQGNLSHPLL